VAYEITADAPAVHTLVELPPNLPVIVEANGKRLSARRTNSQGVLQFRDGGTGMRKVSIRSAEPGN
jgi:hypothetical protein